jgi:hypothetical protein
MPLLHHINAVIAGLRALIGFMSDPYRPELHYMRGPVMARKGSARFPAQLRAAMC